MKSLLILSLFFSFNTYSFTLSNGAAASFPENEVKINVANNTCDNIPGLTPQRILELSVIAVDRFWNTVPTSRLRLIKGSVVNVASEFKTDPVCSDGTCSTLTTELVHTQDIIISCNNDTTVNFNNTTTLAIALPNNISGEDINGAVVLINDSAGTLVDELSEAQLISTIAHEIGHALGLGHSREEENLMYFATSTDQFYLGEDDVDGITYLYGTSQPFSGCGSISTTEGPKGPGMLIFLLSFMLAVTLAHHTKVRSLLRL